MVAISQHGGLFGEWAYGDVEHEGKPNLLAAVRLAASQFGLEVGPSD